jgi:hypothetical protein
VVSISSPVIGGRYGAGFGIGVDVFPLVMVEDGEFSFPSPVCEGKNHPRWWMVVLSRICVLTDSIFCF